MNCQGCGRSLAPGTVFCDACGSAAPQPQQMQQPMNGGFNQPPNNQWGAPPPPPPQNQWGAPPPPNQGGWNNNQPQNPNDNFQMQSGSGGGGWGGDAWGGHNTWNNRNALGEGIASVVMAIISFIVLWWLGIAAIIAGVTAIATAIRARSMQSQNGQAGNQWLGGLITGVIGTILGVVSVVLFWLMIW